MGLAQTVQTWSTSTVDYNNDGYEDVWLGLHEKNPSKLMRNNHDGTYTWVAQNAWPHKNTLGGIVDRHDCAWSDVDGNGLVDAYCSGGRNMSNMVKSAAQDNELWLQVSPGTFEDHGTDWGLGEACGRGRHVAFLDANSDGWEDLFVGNETERPVDTDPCNNPANQLPNEEPKFYLNNGGHGFTYTPAWNVNYPHIGVRCAVPMDYNRDGRMDLFACSWESKPPMLLINTGSGFVESASSNGFSQAVSSARLGDLDGDGNADLVLSDPTGFVYRLGLAAGGFAPAVRLYSTLKANIYGWGVAIGDIDGDGRNDLYGQVADVSDATNPDDIVFLNQGGYNFTSLTAPSASGSADKVTTIHSTPGGKASFLVENGRLDTPGPIQVIRLDSLPGNTAPTAAATATCTELRCSFSSAGFGDPDGTITAYTWTFGDGTAAVEGPLPSHVYAGPGSYAVTLTVTDDQGATGAAATNASAVISPVAFVGARSVNLAAKAPKVAVPAGIQAGDRMVLVATSASAKTASAPPGWVRLQQVASSTMLTTVWQRAATAADSAGSTITVTYDVQNKSDVTLLAYRGAAELLAGVAKVAGAGTTHVAPAVASTPAGSWLLTYWAVKGSNITALTPDPTVTSRTANLASASPGISTIAADSGAAVSTGTNAARTAVSSPAAARDVGLSVVIPPRF